MPALLTAIVITCGALKPSPDVLACRAHVYHGAYSEPASCSQNAVELAIEFERTLVATGELTRTKSHGECVPAADTAEVVDYLPKYMQTNMGAASVTIVHFDLVDGVAIERTGKSVPAKKAIKGAAI